MKNLQTIDFKDVSSAYPQLCPFLLGPEAPRGHYSYAENGPADCIDWNVKLRT